MGESIVYSCPQCGQDMRVNRRHVGRSKRCPSCGEGVRMPDGELFAAYLAAQPEGAFGGAGDEAAEGQPLKPFHWLMGGVVPLLMAGYGVGFGIVQGRLWMGHSRFYGRESVVYALSGDPAMVIGIAFVLLGLCLHVSGIWRTLFPQRVSRRVVEAIGVLGVLVLLGGLLLAGGGEGGVG